MTGKILGVANRSAYQRSEKKVGFELSLMALGNKLGQLGH